MKQADKDIVATITKDLLPGEKILVLGYGAQTRTNRFGTCLRACMLFAAMTIILILAANVPSNDNLMKFAIMGALWATLVSTGMVISSMSDTVGEPQHYALTNERFLSATKDGVRTIAKRSTVTKIQNKENKVTIHLGANAILLERQNINALEAN